MRRLLVAAMVAVSTAAAQPNPAGASVEGHVLNLATGAPVRKATVVLTSPGAPIRLVADTDGEGKFQFSGLPAGTYRLTGSRTGFLERAAKRPVVVSGNENVADVEIRLPPHGAIAGRVFDQSGEGVDRARIAVFKQTYRNGRRLWDPVNASTETNDGGEYRIAGLKPGRYILQAYNTRPQQDNRYGSPPNSFYVPVYYPNVLSQEQAAAVMVGVGTEARGIDIQLLKLARPASVRVRGRVTGVPPGSGMEVSVSLLRADGGPFGGGNMVARPPDYGFDLTAAPGQYTLFGNAYAGIPEAYGSAALTLTEDVSGVVLTMNAAPEVTGRISVAEGGAKVEVAGIRVSMIRSGPGSNPLAARPDGAGRFTFSKPIPPGHYAIVSMRGIPDNCFVRELKLDGKEISWDEFEIAASAQMEIVLSNTAGRIAGTVVDGDGKAAPGASVTLISGDGKSRPVKLLADDAGGFQFASVRPGKYRLFAWEEVDDDLWQDPDFRKDYESRSTEVTVGPGEAQSAQPRVIAAEAIK